MKIIKDDIDMNFVRKWMDNGINPVVLSILSRRGINNNIDLYRFLNSDSIGCLPSPFLFEGIEKAFERIERAVVEGERIILFGDRDVDGVTSIHIMKDFLTRINAVFDWFVPVGNEPYGLNPETIHAWPDTYGLLITVDCGITNHSEIEYLKARGVDTIVIDHHHVHEIIPHALVIINPKYKFNHDFSDMAACVVSFLFVLGYYFWKSEFYGKVYRISLKNEELYIKNLMYIQSSDPYVEITETMLKTCNNRKFSDSGICKEYLLVEVKKNIFNRIQEIMISIEKYIQHATLGTISDIMPLISINRIIVTLGINDMRTKPDKRIQILIEKAGLDNEIINSNDIAWKITPILNSSGRMGDARLSVDYLDQEKTSDVLTEILNMNDERRKQGEDAFNSFSGLINENLNEFNNNLNFFCSDKISRGVIGITANKLCELSKKPVIVCAADEDIIIGSMRGNSDIHLVDFLAQAKELLDEYGGHQYAAGFRFKKDNLDKFRDFLYKNANLLIKKGESEDGARIDAEIPGKYLNASLYKDLSILEPFGEKNELPLLYTQGLGIDSFSIIGKDKNHLKLVFDTRPEKLSGVFWDKGKWFAEVHRQGMLYNILYKLELNVYKGAVSIQMKIMDMEPL